MIITLMMVMIMIIVITKVMISTEVIIVMIISIIILKIKWSEILGRLPAVYFGKLSEKGVSINTLVGGRPSNTTHVFK